MSDSAYGGMSICDIRKYWVWQTGSIKLVSTVVLYTEVVHRRALEDKDIKEEVHSAK